MAAPPERTIRDMNGNWIMSKTLGDNPEPILSLQGVGWFVRKTIGAGTVTLSIKQYTDDEGKVHVDIHPTIVGGIKGDSEYRTLTGDWAEQENGIFGKVKGWSKFLKLDELDDEHLKTGWLDADGEFVGTYAESIGNGWKSMQVWGFEMINNERRYTRHVTVSKGDKVIKIRQVYDYTGSG